MTADTPSPSEVVAWLRAIAPPDRPSYISCANSTTREMNRAINQAADLIERLSSPRSSTVDDLAEKIGRALANDPVCGGRVCQDTVDYIASLVLAALGSPPMSTRNSSSHCLDEAFRKAAEVSKTLPASLKQASPSSERKVRA